MTDKLKMQAEPMKEILRKVSAICPAAVQDNKIDFERLKDELAPELREDETERYDFTWVGKRKSIIQANTPIRKTLRPAVDESKDWDKTENLYIEGDNLDVLKVLQDSYLKKVKMVYIDPPYNTGKDFVYRDNFTKSRDEYADESGEFDGEGNRLFVNNETNGRFHSDWCSMMYPRLKLARDFLTDDGVIFISIDDNEVANLRKICDEVFGEENLLACFNWQTKNAARGVPPVTMVMENHEYILCYAKNLANIKFLGVKREESDFDNPDNDIRGLWRSESMRATGGGGNEFSVIDPVTKYIYTQKWAFSEEKVNEMLKDNLLLFPKDPNGVVRQKKFINSYINENKAFVTNLGWFSTENSTKALMDIFNGKKVFDFPKPLDLLKFLINQATKNNSIVLDFFSGSGATAHAVMQLNATDGGNRKFIMVQLPEQTDEKSEAYKVGYKNICEIGKERIRRAGEKIKSENPDAKDLDIGFRVLKLADTNMKEVYYNPSALKQTDLLDSVDNIKNDRNPLDLLFGVMLDWGLSLDLPLKTIKSGNTEYHVVNDNDLIACFANNVPESVITEIAKLKPLRAVFRDSSFADAPSKINVNEIFKNMSPDTDVKVI